MTVYACERTITGMGEEAHSIFIPLLPLACLMLSVLNSNKPCVLFVGHRQTVKIQIRRRKTRRLIRVFTVCLQNVLLNLNKN